ncbi:MAG: hypothetical protein ACOC42_02165 [Halobacteriota archaeon]
MTAKPPRARSKPRRVLQKAWRDFLSIYYANTRFWRWMKSAALVFLGFFCWTGGAVLLSVRPEWGFLTYVIAYGFALLVWGPLTHFLILPGVIRLRRTASHPAVRWLARNGSKVNLGVFLLIVVILATTTPGVMMLEFSPILSGDGGDQTTGSLTCDRDGDLVTCRIEEASGFDHVVVTTGAEELAVIHDPPWTFTVEVDRLVTVRTGRELTVELRSEDGTTLRRFIRRFEE